MTSAKTDTLLVEIGTEELPPKSLQSLSDAFNEQLSRLLSENDIAFTTAKSFASARRLAVQFSQVVSQQADKEVEKRGPSVSVAFDADGNPTKAAEGWARGNGITVAEAERLETDKGDYLLFRQFVAGKCLADVLPNLVEKALKQLPIPKPMRWGTSDVQFIRPIHTVTLMYGSELIAGHVMGISSSSHLLGHRFHCPQGVELTSADTYENVLESAHVVPDFNKRREQIAQGIHAEAQKLGGRIVEDDALLDEVTALVEWPVVLHASFGKEFLAVPKEPLIVTMKDDQRYFPLENADGSLLPYFVFVTNIESKDPQQIISGNEKVVRPRLADAQFFFETDKKHTLESRLLALGNVLFQKQLGTIADKANRISDVAAAVAELIGANATTASRAGLLAKADLASQMVSEFPETQGVMGMHYARLDNEPKGVPEAIFEHYLPRFAGDSLPTSAEGAAVAIADKLDTLVGIFGIGQVPKGDRDPFALRRAAIGLLRILVELKIDVDLNDLVNKAAEALADKVTSESVRTDVVDFLLGRFRAWYQDQSIPVDVIQAVEARRPTNPVDFDARVQAVNVFRNFPEASALAAANKRVANILAKSDISTHDEVDEALLQDDAEKALFAALKKAQTRSENALKANDYEGALIALATLQEPVDGFFDGVMVNAEEESLRRNRYALLLQLQQAFLRIADISLLN